MHKFILELKKHGITDIKVNEPLSRHTTLKVGGPADCLVFPRNKEELQWLIALIGEYSLPLRVIGRGSNLLVKDGGIRGVVIKLDEGFNHLKVDGTTITVGAGYSTVLLAATTVKQRLKGLEFAGGIPGNIGGAVYMNAGAHGSEISNILISSEVVLESGKCINLSNEEMQFRYRTSILQNEVRGIVTQATFLLAESNREEVSAMFARFKNQRKMTQPLQFPCAGSVFRNPQGDFAGCLIQQAGLKGYRIGDAQVSTLHANFIINRGQAKAKDVLSLIQHIIETVEGKFQVRLEPEVQVVGEE